MAEFIWRATERSGRTQHGRLDAASAPQAALQLRSRGLVPLSIEAASGALPQGAADLPRPRPWSLSLRRNPSISGKDILSVTTELSIMLRAGLPLAYALKLLLEMGHNPALRTLLQEVLDDVKGGAPLSRALARHPAQFGEFYVSMVRAGEAGGQLAVVLERLVGHMERIAAMRENVVSAATYPAILLGVSVLSVIGMIGFVVPQFEKLFADLGDAIPFATRVVLMLSHVFRDWGLLIGIVLVIAVWAGRRWAHTPAGHAKLQARLLRLPLVGKLLLDFQLTVFARTMGTLVAGGVSLLGAIEIAISTVTSPPVRQAMSGMASSIKGGGRLTQALAETRQFEPLAVNLVRVGEETGRLGPMLLEVAQLLDRRVETGVRRLLTLLEPALILLLGGLIATIIVSILLGILAINDLAV
ncbi:MAG: type secretion system protein [Ramlibacter sp.]|jgi:general secretion pathway protein F|nr:type secretion system protein [Ramlibacter sp.]